MNHLNSNGLATIGRNTDGSSDQADFLFIGELAQKTGTNPRTIRFYEREGLLAPVRHGRFRVYSRANERRLQSILQMRAMGMPLVQIREILSNTDPEGDPLQSETFLGILRVHLNELERRRSGIVIEIEAAQNALQNYATREAC